MNHKGGGREHLTPNEVAALLMVNPVTVRQWAARGLLPARSTPGGHRRFLLRDVQDFARRRGVAGAARSDHPARVLVIDADERTCRFIVDLIRSRDPSISTEIARDGFEAGARWEAFRPDALVLELSLPGVDAQQLCRRLRRRTALGPIRIVAVTQSASDAEVERVLGAGADACLRKPLDTHLLLRELGLAQP